MVSPVIAVVVLTGVLVLALVAWRAAVSGRVWPVLWLLPPVGVAIVGELVAAGMATGAGPEGLVPALEAAAAAWAPALQARWGAAVLATLAAVGAAALAGRVEAQDPRWSPVGWGVLGVAGLAGLWVAIGAGLWIGASGAAAGVVLGVA